MSEVRVNVNTENKTISFCGRDFIDWANIRWLRAQLRIMELNATVLWGVEPSIAKAGDVTRLRDPENRFTVIKGDKED